MKKYSKIGFNLDQQKNVPTLNAAHIIIFVIIVILNILHILLFDYSTENLKKLFIVQNTHFVTEKQF